MNGLKVYLKSGAEKVYIYAQGVVGLILIANALREYEQSEGNLAKILVTILAGVILMLGGMVPKRWRRNLRYAPGVLIILGGFALLWLSEASLAASYSRFDIFLIYFSYVIMGFGLLQPLADPRHYAFFSAEGVRYRFHAFKTYMVKWTDVKGIVYFEEGFELALNNRRTFRMRPHNGQSQNLRLYIDQMMQAGKQKASEKEPARAESVERVGSAKG